MEGDTFLHSPTEGSLRFGAIRNIRTNDIRHEVPQKSKFSLTLERLKFPGKIFKCRFEPKMQYLFPSPLDRAYRYDFLQVLGQQSIKTEKIPVIYDILLTIFSIKYQSLQ